eukprot:1148650-Pelagomonas_calceolata.AAC.1
MGSLTCTMRAAISLRLILSASCCVERGTPPSPRACRYTSSAAKEAFMRCLCSDRAWAAEGHNYQSCYYTAAHGKGTP